MTRGFAEKYGLWAFVAGASTGIGVELSREAARRGLTGIQARGAAQLDEAPPERRISIYGSRSLALIHNLGGYSGDMVSFVSIVGPR